MSTTDPCSELAWFAERVRAVGADQTADSTALAQAETTVCLRVRGRPGGLTLLMDREPIEVLEGEQPTEIELVLDAEQLRSFGSGSSSLQTAILGGQASYRGPVRKLLVVTAVLRALLRDHAAAGEPPPGAATASTSPTASQNGGFAERTPGEFWAIECRRLSKRFGRDQVLRELDLGIPEGMISVLLGPSGAGKSVLLKHVIGLFHPDAGEILIRGESLAEMDRQRLMALRRSSGVLFQDGALWASMNLYDNVAFPLRQHSNLTEAEIAEVVHDRLAEVGLLGAERQLPATLSGGMRKRAGFARALVFEPQIVLFDEPDSGLDPVRTARLAELIRAAHESHGGTYVVVTHNIALARQLGEYLALLWDGSIVEAGPREQIFRSQDPFVRQFLAGETAGPLGMD